MRIISKLVQLFMPLKRIVQKNKIKETGTNKESSDGWASQFEYIPTTYYSSPVDIYGLSGITAVAEGLYHSAALKEDGTVWTWGVNWFGQLGNSTTNDSRIPIMIDNLSKITAISVGKNHTVALKNDGTVWAWGSNLYGQLGNGSNEIQINTPVMVAHLIEIIDIKAGMYHTFALRNDGTIWGWGHNDNNKSDTMSTISNTPSKVGLYKN